MALEFDITENEFISTNIGTKLPLSHFATGKEAQKQRVSGPLPHNINNNCSVVDLKKR